MDNNKTMYNKMRTKRILTTLKKFFVLVVMATIGTVVANARTDTWDGVTPATLTDAGIEGTGQNGNPYIINSARAFAYFGSVMNGNSSHWVIERDLEINLNGNTWTYGSLQNVDTYFGGTLDGQNAKVTNFKLSNHDAPYTGLFCGISGTVENLHVSNATFTDGNTWNQCGFGIFAAVLNGGSISTCSVSNSTMTFSQSLSHYGNVIGIGGMVGIVYGDNDKIVNSKVTGLTITTGTQTCQGTDLYIGGVAGVLTSLASLNRCGASGCNFNIRVTDTSNYPVGHVAVGGVVGNIYQPCAGMPEDLCAYNCKIYCPVGSVGPVCGVFIKSTGSSAATVTDDYSAENGQVSAANREKTSSWMYNGYKLGIVSAVTTRSNKNYTSALTTEDGVGYLTIAEPATTFTYKNSVNNSARSSYTVLWYDKTGTNSNTSVYPSYTGSPRGGFPAYYAYFMQGYNVGSYVSEEQATAFINSLAVVKKRAELVLTDENLGQRGICAHTIRVDVTPGDEENITWTWYVDGVAMEYGSTTTTLGVAPKYSGPVNVVVMSSDGASASLTLPRAYLATEYCPHFEDGSITPTAQQATIEEDNRTRGTSVNPYVIGTEEELRLWSTYSRLNGTVENGLYRGALLEDGAEHFNTSYFKLVNNIEMSAGPTDGSVADKGGYTGTNWQTRHKFNPDDHFEPICGFTNEEIYDQEHTFRGNFDGQGHIISGLHQIWAGGTLNMTYAEQGTQCWGLFGCVGGDKNHPAVIKNVIIKDALFEHDVYTGGFLYAYNVAGTGRTGNDTRGTNVAIGALAGMVTNYTTVKNIDVRNTAIYASSPNYNLANNTWSCIDVSNYQAFYHLWAGGVIGRVQAAYDIPQGDLGGTIDLSYMSVDVDLDLSVFSAKRNWNKNNKWLAPYSDVTGSSSRLSCINLGGIVGSMFSTGGTSSVPWPMHAFFTGQHRAMMATAGVMFGYVSWGGLNENIVNPTQAHQHWCGPNGVITNGYYNNYYIRLAKADEETWAYTQVTNTTQNIYKKGAWRKHAAAGLLWEERSSGSGNPANLTTIDGGRVGSAWYNNQTASADIQAVCGTKGTVPNGMLWYIGPLTPTDPNSPLFNCSTTGYTGIRSILAHNESTLETEDDLAGYYQGINHGIWKDWSSETNQNDVVDEFDKNAEYAWYWDPETGRPILSSTHSEHLSAKVDDNVTKVTATLEGVTVGLNDYTYAWYDACGDTKVQDFAAAGGSTNGEILNITQKPYDQYFYAVAKNGTEGSEGYKFFKSKIVRVPGSLQGENITAELRDNTENPDVIAATTYNHQQYLDVRISQSQYYALPEATRLKTPADYYPCKDQDDCFNKWVPDYKSSLAKIEVGSDGYYIAYDPWNTDYTPEPTYDANGNITNKDAIWAAYQAHFDNAPGEGATPKNDDTSLKMLLRIGAIYYTYDEFMALDQRTGTYDADAANSGYTYSFDGHADDPRAGVSYIHKDVTAAAFAASTPSDATVAAQKKYTLSVVLTPSEAELIAAGFVVNYQWYKLDGTILDGETHSSIEIYNDPDNDRGAYLCRVWVEDNNNCFDGIIFDKEFSKSWGKTYIYINPDGVQYPYSDSAGNGTTGVGNDANDGKTPETPVKTWSRAYSLLKENGTWDENQIILIGTSSEEYTRQGFGLGTQDFNGNSTTGSYDVWYQRGLSKFMTRNATISSKRDAGATFNGKFVMANAAGNGPQLALFGDTRFENLVFSHASQSGGYGIIACQYHNLEMGKGLIMAGFPSASSASAEVGPLPGTQIADLQIFGGCNNDDRFLRMTGSVALFENEAYVPHPEGFTITVKSGFYSNICASGRQTGPQVNGIAGTPNRPIKCKIVVDIDRESNNQHYNYGASNASYDVGAVMAGNHEGAQYGDVDIIIRSGIIGRVTSGSLGNKRDANTFGSYGGFRGYKSYYGTSEDEYFPFDTYFGRCNILIDPKSSTVNKSEDIDSRVVISEIYGGALGRHMGNTTNGVCMSTFYGKTYITINGGTFDLNSPSDNTSWTGTAGSGNGKYGLAAYSNTSYNVSVGGTNKTYYRAQPGIYAAGAGGFNGIGGDELHTNDLRLPYWADANNTVSALQRLENVLVNPTRIVKYGKYDVYKTKTGADKVYIECLDSIKYGTRYVTKIDPAETSTTITINGGNFFPRQLPQGAGIYGAGNGYVNNQLINYSAQAPNPLGGSLLGKPGTTAVEMNINGGTFNCNVYGGGRGNDIYYASGLSYSGNGLGAYIVNNASDPEYESFGVTRDNYSRNARIVGNVVMNINGGLFKQNIYGSGSGSELTACDRMAEVIGSTTINITSDSSLVHVLGNVYGGGENAKVREVSAVNVDKGIIYGSVFGGGNKATVGVEESQPYYAASSYWQKSDNVAACWTDENGSQMSADQINEAIEHNNVIRTGTATDYVEHGIGTLKDNPGTPIGYHNVGTGRAMVYTKTSGAKVYGDIFGGGDQAEIFGDTYVGMSAGYIGGSIFGGGNGTYVGENNASNKKASVHGFSEVFLNGYTVMWNEMFDIDSWKTLTYNQKSDLNDISSIETTYIKKWATNKARFIDSTDPKKPIWLDPHGGRNAHNVFGGGNMYCDVDSTARVTVTRGMTPKALLETDEWKNSYYDNDNPHFYVFGGGYGAQTNVNNTYVNVGMEGVLTQDATTDQALAKPSSIFVDEDGNEVTAAGEDTHNIGIFSNGYGIANYTVLGVLGGGMEGIVKKNTEVVIGGNTFIHRVYGGGYGKRDRSAYTEVTNLGRVKGHTRVKANGGLVYGDIFGGGARGDVDSTTFVEVLRDCKVYGSVFGGGDVASVGNSTYAGYRATDTISTVVAGGGIIYHNAFAGGSRGPIYGSTLINVVDSVMNGKPVSPYIYGDIYGGGEKANVTSNSNVLIEGGYLSGDIFGGGLGTYNAAYVNNVDSTASANINGDANVTINGGSALWSEQCDDYRHGTVYFFDNSAVIPTSRFKAGELTADDFKGAEGFFDLTTDHFTRNHNIYGGGNVNSTVTGNTNVTVNHALVTTGLQYYDNTSMSPFAVLWYKIIQNKSYPQFSVLGGGYGQHTLVNGNTNVALNIANYTGSGFDLEGDSVEYKAYKTYKAYEEDYGNFEMFENELLARWTALDPDQKRLLYGGVNSNVYRRFRASRYAWSGGVPGHVVANVYGGSWAGKVAGNASVVLDGTSGCRNVFGGGVGMATASANDDKLGEVAGKATVDVRNAIISGNVYGGGAGVESNLNENGVPTLDYYNVARVVDSTSVSIDGAVAYTKELDENNKPYPVDGTLIYGSVTGGGDVANVGSYTNPTTVPAENVAPVTNVMINGGLVFSQVYAGGSGRVSSLCVDYTKVGAVYGNTKLSVNTPASDINAPWLWNRLYGGGMCGTVYGNTRVDIAGGNHGYNIFGGGYGVVDTLETKELLLTDAAVKGNTRVNITGGEWCISQTWVNVDEEGNDVRAWAPSSTYGNKTYSSQYDPEYKRFKINHNIYGGGNACSTIGGSTYVNMTKGMISETTPVGRDYDEGNFFAQHEWQESYDKVGSAHFSVFGAGYGDKTLVTGNTHVDVSIDFDNAETPSAEFEENETPYYQRFKSLQSLLDVIGGGYNGLVDGDTYVHIGGKTFMRRVFTGGYYAPVNTTNLLVTSGDVDEVFGGGLIGDVYENTNVQVGCRANTTFDGKEYTPAGNSTLFINKNVYGGNDVSGTIGYKNEQHTEGQGTHLSMYGGNLYGDVYGGGNGDYLYALGQNNETKVTPNEHYKKGGETYDLVYTVPMRPGMISSSFASDAQKIVNINSYRPSTIESNIELYGRSNDDRLVIKGNVFGGGNCATVDGVVDNRGNNSARVNFKIKDNINVGGVFLGSDGDALFLASTENPFLDKFQTLNDIFLADSVIWDTDPANHGIKLKYLPVENEDRPIVYPHLLDLYFQPVEMSIQPVVKWGTSESLTGDVNNATIGVFCCGGNRGNMNVYPSEDRDNRGNVVDITFPENLVITGHIIGGCNNANYDWPHENQITKHVGGYLLGERKSENPMIKLLVRNKFQPSVKEITADGDTHYEYAGGNVYGGCYKSGTINGDVTVDLRSNMLNGLHTDYFENITDIGASACNVYGAGYGTNSYVYGDTKVIVGAETVCKTNDPVKVSDGNGAKGNIPSVANATYEIYNDVGTSANYIFGGGLQGNVVGNSTVRYLNGRTLHSVTGGSYAGYLWGSTQVLVGYPDYYTVKEGKQGVYTVARKDKSEDNLKQTTVNVKGDTEKAIKQEVKLMAGDIIAPTLYEAIIEADNTLAEGESKEAFTRTTTAISDEAWENIDINIGEAIYGGGYSLASGTSVMANNTIVLKYDDQYNTDTEETTLSSVGYGGNTTMVVWDKVKYDGNGFVVQPGDDLEKDIDHVTISQQEMTEVDLPHGTDLFGYYYKDRFNHYHYIYEENKYFQGLEYPKPPLYTGTYVSAYDFEAEGGLYGDGHLSFSEGFRTGEIKGYGLNGGRTIEGARLMNSFQRMDILRVEDCNVIMLGARDYATNVTNTTPYSMSRIGELQMVSHIDDTGDLRPVSVLTMDNDDTYEGQKAARNFLGLSNNILYVGCIYTNTPFSDKWHNFENSVCVDSTYQQRKQDYINKFYAAENDPNKIEEGEFQKRNDGTAKNMIGVSSGYALKIQNVTSQAVGKVVDGATNVTTQVDSVFYGPIVGVAEVNLMSSRLNEGGGYIYADNIHDRAADDATSSNGTGKPDFLMTTGNFVFPHTEAGRYILDDCYVKRYDESLKLGQPAEHAHYWYIEGYNYFYNIHITGYTSDSRNEPLKFDSDNTDLLSVMKGARAGQKVTLHSIRWRSEHVGTDTSDDKYDECDIDGNYKATGVYPASMTEGVATYGNETLDQRWNDSYYKLRLSAFDDTTVVYRDTPAEGSTTIPVHGDLQRASNMLRPTEMTGELLTDEPVIALQLVDAVDNTTEAYYKRHLSETCKSTIVLTVPALDENNEPITGETSVTAIYTNNNHVGLEDKVPNNTTLVMDNTVPYYYFDDNTHEYRLLDMTKLRYKWGTGTGLENFAPIKTISVNEDGQYALTYDDGNGHAGSITVTSIYVEGFRNYTYTLYLTIDYVQGPEVRGHITINNCALPGEMVRLTTENVKQTADESMRPIGTYWRIGMRKYNEETNRWEFADDTKWVPTTATTEGAAAGYDSYRTGGTVKNGMFMGAVYDETEGYLDVPVYYFMNGYGVQYGIEFNGLEGQIFPVSMAESDTLLVHNFHRMDTHATNKELYLHLSEAAARAKASEDYAAYIKNKAAAGYSSMTDEQKEAWDAENPEKVYVSPLARPRVYISDEQDMVAFYQFVDSVGRYDENKYITEAQLGTQKYAVPTGGKYMKFFVEDNIAFSSQYYHSPVEDFEGDFDGRGHTIDLTNSVRVTDRYAPTLLKSISGGVYNLGVLGKPLAESLAQDESKHVFNAFVYGMNGNNAVTMIKDTETAGNTGLENCYDLSVANDADFKYGRIAYNLNKYYLAERYRRAKALDENDDCIEHYFANDDFQYAHRKDDLTGKNTGITYLRTSTLDLPAYGSYVTRHDMSHPIDEARAIIEYLTQEEADARNAIYNAEYAYEIDAENSGSKRKLTADPYSTSTIKSVKYKAMFNESHADNEHGVDDNLLRNDYILFGQNLTETPDNLPTNIASGLNSEATNRVWRASGFYGSMKDEGFYYNAMNNMATMVNDPRLTAVDLTCQRDGEITADSYQNDVANVLTSVRGAADALQSVYFAPTADVPADATYWKFGVAEEQLDGTHVTKNLLVYTAANTNAATKVKNAIEYIADTPTEEILGHRVVVGEPNHVADLLHLVDKENFNAPMSFVANNAWYDRNPEMETGYVEAAGQGWESVALPFTVQKTTLSEPIERFYDYADEVADPEHKRNTKKEDQSDISFFYGEGDNVEDNPNIINHEYWLRSLTGIDHPEAANSKLSGIFKRPVESQEDGGFTAYVPFVVSFPGSPFYEFDMTDKSMTFSAVNANVAVTDVAVAETAKTITSGTRRYTHYAAFMNEEGDETGTYAIALKESSDDPDHLGDKFSLGATVYPFRAKIVSEAASNTGGAKAASYADMQEDAPEAIYISALGISLEDKGISEPETEEVIESNGMRIYPSGKRIVVESSYATTVNVYTLGGKLVRVLDVRPGTSVFSGFATGVYVVEQKAMSLK